MSSQRKLEFRFCISISKDRGSILFGINLGKRSRLKEEPVYTKQLNLTIQPLLKDNFELPAI